MSDDVNFFGMPRNVAVVPAAAPIPGARTKGARTLRDQAQEIIDEVLGGTAPEEAQARARLRRCVFRHHGHPELALLEQLMSRDESQTSLKDLGG